MRAKNRYRFPPPLPKKANQKQWIIQRLVSMATKMTFFILFQFLFSYRIFFHNWEMFFPSFLRTSSTQIRTNTSKQNHSCTHLHLPREPYTHTYTRSQSERMKEKASHHEPYPFQQLEFVYFRFTHCSNKPHALSLHQTWNNHPN